MLLHMPLLVIIYHLCPPLHILPSPQSLQLWLNIPTPSLPSSSPMAGDHLNVAFHLKLRHMNEHYRILSHKPISV